MGDKSAIEWTDATWNPVRGCDKVSPGCANCYAETFSERWRGTPGHPYEQGFDLRLVPEALDLPLRWSKPRRVFVNSMSDLFHEAVPDAYIDRVFATMAAAPRHQFQVLTKRAERMQEYCSSRLPVGGNLGRVLPYLGAMDRPAQVAFPLPNVWLGVSAESQRFADLRIPLILQTPAALRFVSLEPLLGPVRLQQQNPDGCWPPNAMQPAVAWLRHKDWPDDHQYWTTGLDWVIVGGESGRGARPCDVAWVRAIVEQCKDGHVPVFVKQLGAQPSHSVVQAAVWAGAGQEVRTERLSLHSRKGEDMAEWPEDLRVREYPR